MPDQRFGYMLAVGEVYPGWEVLSASLKQDLIEYNYRGGTHDLRVALDRPTIEEIRAFRSAPFKFALVVKGSVIILLFKVGRLPWGECSYSIHRVHEEDRVLPDLSETDIHALLSVTLINRATGRIEALRAMTFSAEFTSALHKAITEQATLPYDPASYESEIRDLQAAYPKIEDLLPEAIAACQGGD